MRTHLRQPLRALIFVGSSKKDLSGFPLTVKQDIGHALFEAQQGRRAPAVKALKGFGSAGVLEVVEDHDGEAYRCVYTVRLRQAVYVLHAFQKKAKSGIATPRVDIELVRRRLKDAERLDAG